MAKITRRKVLIGTAVTGGALIIGVSLAPNTRLRKARELVENKDEVLLTTWVKISPDNQVTVIVPHAEMGQGVHTSMPMMLAEELEADWGLVNVEQAPAHEAFANNFVIKGFVLNGKQLPPLLNPPANWGSYKLAQRMNMQITGGSTAVRTTGAYGMQVAGAAVKEMLIKAASQTWGVGADECYAKLSHVHHQASGRKATFGELAEAAAAFEASASPKLKDKSDYTIIGTPVPRIDVPSKVDGTAIYGIDVALPDMKIAAIKIAPVFGGKLVSFEKDAVMGRRGIVDVIAIDDAVAVIADNYWRAAKALADLPVTFNGGGNENVDSAGIFDRFRDTLSSEEGEENVEKGDVTVALAEAERVIEAEYQVPYLAHATMEPLNCTAHVKDGQANVWTGTQDGLAARATAAEALGFKQSQVTVHNVQLGGGFGRRGGGTHDYIERSVQIAAQVDYPVKVIWSREEDIRHDTYRPASVSRFKAGLDEKGMPTAFVHRYLMNEEKEAVHIPYSIANQSIRYSDVVTHVPYGSWRSVASSQMGFYIESFIDELAVEAGRDPLDYRLALLDEGSRHHVALKTVAKMAGWGKDLPAGHGLGIAVRHSFASIVAEVAQVSVNASGKLTVHKVCCAADAGDVVNPDTFVAQMESGIIFGLTAALYGEITIADGGAVQSNFPDYEMVKLADVPEIHVEMIRSGAPYGGVGEPGTPPIAPAVTNAIFAATGKRIRSLPIKNHDFGVRGQVEG